LVKKRGRKEVMYLVIHRNGLIESKSTVSKEFLEDVDSGLVEIIRVKLLDIDKLRVTEIYEGDGVWRKI
jgi:hypothetical protein